MRPSLQVTLSNLNAGFCLRVGLAQRMLGRERLDRHAVGVNASCNRIVGRIASAEQLRTRQMRRKTDVRDGRLIADAEPSGARVAPQHLFDAPAALVEPVAPPRAPHRLAALP